MVLAAAVLLTLLCVLVGFGAGVYAERLRGVPLWQHEDRWSIGIYIGDSPFGWREPPGLPNPVLTARDVTDVDAEFVADPFMVKEDSTWYMFFEVLDRVACKGRIGVASSSDGFHWTYGGIVLREPFHLSYPYVFEWHGSRYMVPESASADSVRLYEAVDFPRTWSFVTILLHGDFVDPSIFYYRSRWWMFAATRHRPDDLRLFHAHELRGGWAEHPQSPVITASAATARPGGRVLLLGDRVIRYGQDARGGYGTQLRVFEVVQLTPTSYVEREASQAPVLKPSGTGWNAAGMHHIDVHRVDERNWIACVDGNQKRWTFRLKY